MEFAGEVDGIKFYDDYGHHPTEIRATLEGLRAAFDGRIVAVFQPHLYSRTKKFYKEFGSSFAQADSLIVLDIFPAREKPINGITGELIVKSSKEAGHNNAVFLKDKEDLPDFMKKNTRQGDHVVLFGAGDIYKYTKKIIEGLKN
jgi:UDP-N-acetylmuramate--alanine ligase